MKSNHALAKNLMNLALILLGNAIYALAVTMFILPAGLITGGTTGLALFFFHQFGLPVTAFVSVFNVAMFLLGLWILGKKFALTTLVSTFFYPFILGVFQKIPMLTQMTDDRLLCAVYAGLMIGFSIGIVIRAGASTGGMDIPPLVLNKKLGLSVSATMYAFDFTILLLQILFSDKEQVLYGILLVMIYFDSRADRLLPDRTADDSVGGFQSGTAPADPAGKRNRSGGFCGGQRSKRSAGTRIFSKQGISLTGLVPHTAGRHFRF